MTRVLHLLNDLDTGGAQTLVEALAQGRADPSLVVVLLGRGALSERLESAAAAVIHLGLSKRAPNVFAAMAEVRRLVGRHAVDVVHSHLLQSDLVSLLTPLGVPRVSTLHTSGGHESGRSSRVVGAAVARMSGRFDAVVACSQSAQSYAYDRRYRPAAPVEVIPNGVHIPGPQPPTAGRRRSLLCLSRWHPMKDHRTLLEAFGKVVAAGHDVELVLAGGGVDSRNQQLSRWVGEYGLDGHVRLLGAVADVPDLLAVTDALVISSSHGEALPMAGIEALAHSRPVITTDVGDCRTLAIHADLVVAPRAPASLAEAIVRVLSQDEERRTASSAAARALALERFDVTTVVNRYESVYDRVVNMGSVR